MKEKYFIITNNPLVKEELGVKCTVQLEDISYFDTLVKARDLIYSGHVLLSHPLSGSIKPNETPYKSIMISVDKGQTDLQSVGIIEKAIEVCGRFVLRDVIYKPEVYEDFQLVDKTLIESALPSADAW